MVVGFRGSPNNPTINFQRHTASIGPMATATCSTFVELYAFEDCFLLIQEIMVDPKLKQHPDVLFQSVALLAQSESVYPCKSRSSFLYLSP